MEKNVNEMMIIARELKKLSSDRFTGKVNLVINWSQGGIASMSLLVDRTLKKG